MTDAKLMDADCIHGVAWYECKVCEREMNDDLMGGLGVPFAIELSPPELDLLYDCIAWRLARMLSHRGDLDRERFEEYAALGRRFGMEL